MIADILSQIGAAEQENLLVVSVGVALDDDDTGRLCQFPNISRVSDLALVDDLPSDLGEFSLALVLLGDGVKVKNLATQLLGRLRDSGVARTAVSDPTPLFAVSEMLALGYIAVADSAYRVFLYDPDEFFSRREWNDARDWANPENFRRYRW